MPSADAGSYSQDRFEHTFGALEHVIKKGNVVSAAAIAQEIRDQVQGIRRCFIGDLDPMLKLVVTHTVKGIRQDLLRLFTERASKADGLDEAQEDRENYESYLTVAKQAHKIDIESVQLNSERRVGELEVLLQESRQRAAQADSDSQIASSEYKVHVANLQSHIRQQQDLLDQLQQLDPGRQVTDPSQNACENHDSALVSIMQQATDVGAQCEDFVIQQKIGALERTIRQLRGKLLQLDSGKRVAEFEQEELSRDLSLRNETILQYRQFSDVQASSLKSTKEHLPITLNHYNDQVVAGTSNVDGMQQAQQVGTRRAR